MAGEKYADKAVVALAAYVRANLPAQLRAVETAQSLTTNSLEDPVEVVERRAPADNRSVLVEVFDQGGEWADYRSRIWATDCTIAIGYTGDADAEAGDEYMRRYASAVISLLAGNETLGSTVIEAVLTDYGDASGHIDASAIRHTRTFGVLVHTDER